MGDTGGLVSGERTGSVSCVSGGDCAAGGALAVSISLLGEKRGEQKPRCDEERGENRFTAMAHSTRCEHKR